MIPVLVEEGYQWIIVANSHLARTCPNYLDVAPRGTSGWNIDPPNRADQLGPVVPAAQWWRGQLDGRGGTFPAPFAYQAHRAKYVNPETGAESTIGVVPMCDLLSYQNGYGMMGTSDLDAHIAPFNDPARPSLVLMAHDGDNAWGGGYDYYLRSVPDLFHAAAARGYRPTTIQQFLADHPVPAGAVVHVEDGAWVNAANDWGHPQFINWLWPPARSPSDPAWRAGDPRTWYDIENGWSEDWRNWAVLMAGANYCETAEQIIRVQGGTVLSWKIQEPVQPNGTSNHPNAAEQAWHFYLAGLDSGFMYYGTALDDEVKQTLAVNRAIAFATNVIGNGALEQTPPTVFKPQRFPWNPGGMGWGPLTGYREVGFNGQPPWPADFYVWTLVFDVSGVTNVTLFVRVDADGVNPLADNANETYAGGPGVGPWTALPMTRRGIPTHNLPGDPNIHFFLLPTAIADHYWARVTGYTNVLLDYYVQAVDARGNVHRSDIQHVWVDSGLGGSAPSTNGCNGRVCVAPAPLVAGNSMTVFYDPTGGPLAGAGMVRIHFGWNNWSPATITELPMTWQAGTNRWHITLTPPLDASQFDCVFHNGSGLWDNNSGADWHFPVLTNSTPQPPATPTGLTLQPVHTNQINLAWNAAARATGYLIHRNGAPLALTTGTTYADTGLAANTPYCYSLLASNSVGLSPASATLCTNTPAGAPTNFAPFVMDGTADFPGYLVASDGLTLYAALRGTKLYVATRSPGTSGPNDHFIFVSDALLGAASAAAPWAKSGWVAVAPTKPYLASESLNTYVAWYNAPSGSAAAKSATSTGHLEGVMDLAAAFGTVPAHIYLAAAAYATADGGALVAQSPAGSGPHLEPAEFFVIPTAALRDHNADGLFDRLDPARDFRLLGLSVDSNGLVLTWAVMPGRTYQMEVTTAPGTGWSNLSGTLTTAGPLQLELGATLPLAPTPPAQFYRLKRLP